MDKNDAEIGTRATAAVKRNVANPLRNEQERGVVTAPCGKDKGQSLRVSDCQNEMNRVGIYE